MLQFLQAFTRRTLIRRPLHNRHHDHPIPYRSPRRIQPLQSPLEARAVVPLAHPR